MGSAQLRLKKMIVVLGVCAVLTALLIGAVLTLGSGGRGEAPRDPMSAHPPFASLQDLHTIGSREHKDLSVQGRIRAAVVPHHLVAGSLTNDILRALARQKPPTLIIVGPNHGHLGAKVITGFYHWDTPQGQVKTEAPIVQELISRGLAVRDEAVLSQEHSVGALASLMKQVLPETTLVPLILHRDVSLQEVDQLREVFEPYLQQGAVLVGSVDFSHFLQLQEAEARDVLTLKLIAAYDYSTLYRLGNDYLDSPASLSMVLREAQVPGRQLQVVDHSNSAIILKNDSLETTSYITLVVVE